MYSELQEYVCPTRPVFRSSILVNSGLKPYFIQRAGFYRISSVRATNKVGFSAIRGVFTLRAHNSAGFNLISFSKPVSDRTPSVRDTNKVGFSAIRGVFTLWSDNSADFNLISVSPLHLRTKPA
jgi:hypothetical protein